MSLFNIELVGPGTEMPSQGTNLNTPQKRLLIAQGTGQHRGFLKPPPFQAWDR